MTTSSLPKTVKSRAQSLLGVAALSAIAFVGVPQSAEAANILLGSDYLNTPAGSSFFNFPGLGSIQFQGSPIGLPIGPGNTDTIIERKQDCIFGVNNSCQIDIEMVDLSLKSSAPVNIGGSLFDVFVSLTPGTNSTGTMTINHEFADHNNSAPEGTFTSVLDVFFDAKFTPVGGGGVSCTLFAGPNCTLSLFSQLDGNGLWGHEPPPGAVIVNGLPGDQVANLHRPLVPGFNDFFIFGIGNHDHKNFAGQHNVITTTCPIGLPGCPGPFVNMPMPDQQRNIKPVPEPSTVLASILVGLTAMFGLKKKQESQKA